MPVAGSSGGRNLKDIKRASVSVTADLSNVNCHLSPFPPKAPALPPPAQPPPPPPPGQAPAAAGQGWRGNLIKGSPVTKALKSCQQELALCS